jgi:hypothetical protein
MPLVGAPLDFTAEDIAAQVAKFWRRLGFKVETSAVMRAAEVVVTREDGTKRRRTITCRETSSNLVNGLPSGWDHSRGQFLKLRDEFQKAYDPYDRAAQRRRMRPS